MSVDLKKTTSNGHEKMLSLEEQQSLIMEVRRLIGPLSGKASLYCSDASIARHLRARNWNVKKAVKMLKQTLKWRAEYKPEEIRWEDVAQEADTGKIYRTDYVDKHGRTVLVMRPSRQNSKSIKGQMVKPLLEPKTYNKVKFVYADDNNTKKIMEDLFDLDQLESAFGGKNDTGFDINRYAERMKEDDKKIPSFWTGENSLSSVPVAPPSLDSIKLDSDSDPSDYEKRESSPDLDPDPRMDTEIVNHNDENVLVNQEYGNARVDTH